MSVSVSEVEKTESSKKTAVRRHYTEEFQIEAVQYYRKAREIDPQNTIKDCAAELGVIRSVHGMRGVPHAPLQAAPSVHKRAESLMGTIKSECVHARTYRDREQAAPGIFEYIECFYNRLRLHSALGYMSPCGYEETRATRPFAA